MFQMVQRGAEYDEDGPSSTGPSPSSVRGALRFLSCGTRALRDAGKGRTRLVYVPDTRVVLCRRSASTRFARSAPHRPHRYPLLPGGSDAAPPEDPPAGGRPGQELGRDSKAMDCGRRGRRRIHSVAIRRSTRRSPSGAPVRCAWEASRPSRAPPTWRDRRRAGTRRTPCSRSARYREAT